MRQLRVRVCSELWCGDWKSVWRHFQRALCEGSTPGQACLGSATKEMIHPVLVPVTAATFPEGRFANLTLSPLWTRVWFGRTEPGSGAGSHPVTLELKGKAELPWESFLSWVFQPSCLCWQHLHVFRVSPNTQTEDKAGALAEGAQVAPWSTPRWNLGGGTAGSGCRGILHIPFPLLGCACAWAHYFTPHCSGEPFGPMVCILFLICSAD